MWFFRHYNPLRHSEPSNLLAEHFQMSLFADDIAGRAETPNTEVVVVFDKCRRESMHASARASDFGAGFAQPRLSPNEAITISAFHRSTSDVSEAMAAIGAQHGSISSIAVRCSEGLIESTC